MLALISCRFGTPADCKYICFILHALLLGIIAGIDSSSWYVFLLIKAGSFGQRSGHPRHLNSLLPFDPALDAPDLFNRILPEPAPPDSLYLSRLLLSFFLPSLASAPNPVSQIYQPVSASASTHFSFPPSSLSPLPSLSLPDAKKARGRSGGALSTRRSAARAPAGGRP